MHNFVNHKTGKTLNCDFRLVTCDSEQLLEGLQTCVIDEYGQTYPKHDVYDRGRLSELIKEKRIVALLAVSGDGDPVSSIAATPCGGLEDVPELTMHVVRKPYRGYGIGTVLTKAMLALPSLRACCAVTTHSVTFHPMAQHQTLDCGLIPSGFLFNVHSNEILKHSFDTMACVKQSFAVGIYPEQKKDAGTVYAPARHREFIQRLYDRLGARCTFAEGPENTGKMLMHTNFDETHHTLTAEIFRGGQDVGRWAEEMLNKPHHPHQTANVLVDLHDPAAAHTYETLARYGFIFTGMHPLCANGEFMLLHHPMDMDVKFGALCVDEGYMEVFKYIKDCAGGKI